MIVLEVQEVKTFGNPPVPVEDVVDAEGNTYCQVHTDRETGLRCNNCERLMCASCAVSTPVGYRCEQCVRQREDKFFTADTSYYVKIVAISVVLGAVGAFVANLFGFFLFVFFIAAAAGSIISETVLRATKGTRGRYAAQAVAAGVVAGTVLMVLLTVGPVISQVSGTVTPEIAEQLVQQFGPEEAEQIIAEYQRERGSLVQRIVVARFLDLSLWLYAGITAAIVYGRFNIYGGSTKRKR